jgi:hypothetical protein
MAPFGIAVVHDGIGVEDIVWKCCGHDDCLLQVKQKKRRVKGIGKIGSKITKLMSVRVRNFIYDQRQTPVL